MHKQNKTEKIFAENLDRLLAGKQVKAGKSGDTDMAAALEFAVKMAAIKPAISAQYKNRLKTGLLKKLENREEAAKQNRWSWLQSPAWKAAAAVFVVVLVISLVWRSGVFNLSAPQATTTPAATTTAMPTATTTPATFLAVGNLLGYQVNTDKPVYQQGEKVVINLTLKNTSSGLLTIDKLPPIISIMDAQTGKPVYTFSGGKNTSSLAYGESLQLSYAWDQTDFNGRVLAGNYYIELEDMEYQGQTLKFQQPQPVHFEIKPSAAY